MMITLVALLGLLEGVNISMQQNLKNLQRDEAVKVAEDWMSQLRAKSFDNLSTCSNAAGNPSCTQVPARYQYPDQHAPSRLRGLNQDFYTVIRTTWLSPDSLAAEVAVRVRWKFKNMSTAYEVHNVKSQ
jgi:type IV pilus assembly protein PilV